jgi:predicted ferric reductase
VGDHYINYSIAQVLVPFANTSYRPMWVGLGQVGWYLLVLVGVSFYMRKWIGHRLGRVIHFLSFVVYAIALLHAVATGTDSGSGWVRGLYWITGGSMLFVTIYRVVAPRAGSRRAGSISRVPRTQTTRLEIRE